jgi:hypothetical protein
MHVLALNRLSNSLFTFARTYKLCGEKRRQTSHSLSSEATTNAQHIKACALVPSQGALAAHGLYDWVRPKQHASHVDVDMRWLIFWLGNPWLSRRNKAKMRQISGKGHALKSKIHANLWRGRLS